MRYFANASTLATPRTLTSLPCMSEPGRRVSHEAMRTNASDPSVRGAWRMAWTLVPLAIDDRGLDSLEAELVKV